MSGFTITPELLVSLATLITAITALIRVLQTHQTVTKTASDVAQVKEQTNGALTALQAENSTLRSGQATQLPSAAPPTGQS